MRIAEPAELASTQARALHWRDFMPTITLPERRFARHYALGGMCAFCAFGMFSLFASLAPSFMQRMVPWHGPAVSGLSIGVILFLSAGFQYLARPRPTKGSAIVGFACLVACNLLLLVNSFAGSALLFALSVITTAAGHGLCNLAGMSIVNKVSTPATRTGLLSTYLVVGYLGTIVPILGLGWLSDHIGHHRGPWSPTASSWVRWPAGCAGCARARPRCPCPSTSSAKGACLFSESAVPARLRPGSRRHCAAGRP